MAGKRGRKRRLWALAVCAALILTPVYLWYENNALCVSRYAVDAGLSEPLTIVQISDLHGARFGDGQKKLLALIEAQHPDVIVMTGDLIDGVRGGVEAVGELAAGAAAIAPTYYVTGNHEASIRDIAGLEQVFQDAGVTMLHGQRVQLREDVGLTGAWDTGYVGLSGYAGYIMSLSPQSEGFELLLAHRPEFAADYAAAGFDLALCGHAHGGQVRLPYVGGLYAPGQGVFPKYDAGLYDVEGMLMLVSRGLGNSQFPFRINNLPEVVVLTLK